MMRAMARWVWLSAAAVVVVALAGVFAGSWWIFGRDTATAIATIAAIPIAVAIAVVPPAWVRYRRRAHFGQVQPTLIVSAIGDDWHHDQLHYETHYEGGRTIIEPRDPYLDLVHQGGELTPLAPRSFWGTPWGNSFQWPTLDVKLVNNTDQTLFFHEAVFCVAESRPDLRPIPLIGAESHEMNIPLRNVGWGPMIDGMLRFRLARSNDENTVTCEFEWHFDNPEMVRAEGSLTSFFADVGVDVEMLKRLQWVGNDGDWYYLAATSGLGETIPADGGGYAPLFAGDYYHRLKKSEYEALLKRALGPFPGEPSEPFKVLIRGTLEYTQNDVDGSQTRHVNPFRSYVSFEQPPEGALMPPSWTYQVRLRSEGHGYTVSTPISQAVAAGEADRFLFRIAADRSSLHDFSLKLVYNDDVTLASDPISLELFVSNMEAKRALNAEEMSPQLKPVTRKSSEIL